jgi:hypothetical protein
VSQVHFAIIGVGAGLNGANDEECQENFEDSAAWVVLVGKLHVAGAHIGTWKTNSTEIRAARAQVWFRKQIAPSTHAPLPKLPLALLPPPLTSHELTLL